MGRSVLVWPIVVAMVVSSCTGDDTPDDSVTAVTAVDDEPTATPATDGEPARDAAADHASADTTDVATTASPAPESPEDQLAALLARPAATVEFDVVADASTSADIGPAGGTLQATGSDGTTYSLTVPEGAMLTTQTIEMTPLSSATVPTVADAELIGVRLDPSGLVFVTPATLTFDGDAVPTDALGWGAGLDGSEVVLAPAIGDGVTTSLSIPHFSVHGVGNQELARIVDEHGMPGLGSATTALLAVLLASPSGGTTNAFLTSLRAWLDDLGSEMGDVVGLDDLESATAGVTSLLNVLTASAAISFDPDEVQEINESTSRVTEAWAAAVLRVVARISMLCSEGIDVAFQIARWRTIVTVISGAAAAFGAQLPPDLVETLDGALGQCASVVVTWQPEVEVSQAGNSVTTTATARSGPIDLDTLTVDGDGFALSGRSSGHPFVVDEIVATFPFCTLDPAPGQATMGAIVTATVPAFGSIADADISAVTAIAGDDVPITIGCGPEEIGFEFFSAEYEILNIEQGRTDPQGDGYARFELEPTGSISNVIGRTTTTDSGTRGSTATVTQVVAVEHVGL